MTAGEHLQGGATSVLLHANLDEEFNYCFCWNAGLLASAVQQLFTGQPAIAAGAGAVAAPEAATSTASDAAAAATTMLEKDPVTTVLFTIAIGALSIVTLGVSGIKSAHFSMLLEGNISSSTLCFGNLLAGCVPGHQRRPCRQEREEGSGGVRKVAGIPVRRFSNYNLCFGSSNSTSSSHDMQT